MWFIVEVLNNIQTYCWTRKVFAEQESGLLYLGCITTTEQKCSSPSKSLVSVFFARIFASLLAAIGNPSPEISRLAASNVWLTCSVSIMCSLITEKSFSGVVFLLQYTSVPFCLFIARYDICTIKITLQTK